VVAPGVFFSQDLPGSEDSTQKSLTQRIVGARIDLGGPHDHT
jgi:hypothetical protein